MSNAELDALSKATYKVDQIEPGLVAWLDSAYVWQLQPHNGYHYELQPPEAAIPPEEDAVSIDAAIALRDTSQDGHRLCGRYSMRGLHHSPARGTRLGQLARQHQGGR